jgi:hypothetical protein
VCAALQRTGNPKDYRLRSLTARNLHISQRRCTLPLALNGLLGILRASLSLAKTERWPSGRRRTPGKCVGGEPSRGFESLSLRHNNVLARWSRSGRGGTSAGSRCSGALRACGRVRTYSLQARQRHFAQRSAATLEVEPLSGSRFAEAMRAPTSEPTPSRPAKGISHSEMPPPLKWDR